MAVEAREVPVHETWDMHQLVVVRRWRSGLGGGHSERHVSLGHLPDGSWLVKDTRAQVARLFAGGTSQEARAAAQEHAAALMAGGVWEPTIATFEPGVLPARAAEVPEWPAGHEPGSEQAADER